jgi:putative hydrolase of HD superfamily
MSSQPDLTPDVDFLFEMGSIRFMERMWRRFLHDDFANLAEHHFRTFWIAMVIASREGGVDTGKIAKMVLMHDIAESRTGDVDYLARQYVVRNEELGIKDMLTDTSLEKEFLALWEEYEKRESLEAKIAKDADNLDVDFELAEQAAKGSQLQKDWRENREYVAREKLYTETAKQLFDQLSRANPHDWHLKGRNRRNSGDWQNPASEKYKRG